MQQNALFYRSVVALDSNVHAGKRVTDENGKYLFAKDSHLIPAVIDEFSAAAHRMPIVFTGSEGKATPVFLVGRRPGENGMVDAEGAWTSEYVPAYLRRYPFIIGEVEGRSPIVCFDEASTAVNTSDGEALFADGAPTKFLDEKIDFLNQYLDSAKRTEQLCALLNELQLFVSTDISFSNRNGGTSSLHGLMIVSEERLNALSDEDFKRLRSENLIPVIYAHLFSLRSMETIREV